MDELKEWLPSIIGIASILIMQARYSMKMERTLGEVTTELKFVHGFAAESRKDRDLLRGDVKDLKTEVTGSRERIVRLETHTGLSTSHGT